MERTISYTWPASWGFYIASLCLLFLAPSCKDKWGSQDTHQLLYSIEQVWQLSESSLPEALVRAEGLKDSVSEASEYVRQKYNLLTIRLRDKSYIVPSSPDSALQVMSFFESHGNDVDRERAYFYMSSAYRDLKDYPRAVTYSLKAVEMAKQCPRADTLIWQKSLSKLGYFYMLQLNYEEELNAALQALELAKRSNIDPGGPLTDVAAAYGNLKDTTQCLEYCGQAYKAIQQEHFAPRYGKYLAYMLAAYSKYNHYEKVDTLLQHLMLLPADQRPYNYELGLAMFHENARHTDLAIHHYKTYYFNEKTLSGRYEASAGLQRCYLRKGNSGQAALWGCRLYETNDSIIDQRAFEETQRARDTYLYYRNKEEEMAIKQRDEALARRNQNIVLVSSLSVSVLLSIVLGLVAFYNYRKKKFVMEIVSKEKTLKVVKEEIVKRRTELEQKKLEIGLLGSQLDEAERTVEISKIRLESTMKELEQRTEVNRELTRIALMNNATMKAEDIIVHFRDVADGRAKLKDDAWKGLLAAIETLYPGFMEKVQRRLKRQLREPLLQTICLLKIGMTPIQISKVMDAKKQTVWNRVRRAEETCGNLLTMP